MIRFPFSKRYWIENYQDFPGSLKANCRWYAFMMAILLVDILVITRYGLSVGFTEKGLITARIMEINYWLAGLVSFLVFGIFGMFLIYTRSRNLLIIFTLVVFAYIIGNFHALMLYMSGRLDPF